MSPVHFRILAPLFSRHGYHMELLENARDEAIYGQLGKHQALPRNHGKTVEWRKWNTLPEPDKLVEGVIPEGKKFGQTSLNVAIAQYGEYVSVSDQLELHAIDDTILGATEEVGAAMGSGAKPGRIEAVHG